MENVKQEGNLHCLLLAFPLQGHVNPMLQFSKRLKHKGIARITLAVTKFFLKTANHFPPDSFPVETFSDGGAGEVKPVEYDDICWKSGSKTYLAQLIEWLRSSGSGVDCLIYDPLTKKLGLKAAMFFAQSNSVNAIYFHAYKRELQLMKIFENFGRPILND